VLQFPDGGGLHNVTHYRDTCERSRVRKPIRDWFR
jgi:hypothetical protein